MGEAISMSTRFSLMKSDLAAFLFKIGVIKQKPNESYADHNQEYEALLRLNKEDRIREARRIEAQVGKIFEQPIAKMSTLLSRNPGVRDTAIDIGSGAGFNSARLSKIFKNVIAIEPSEAAVSFSKEIYPQSEYPNIDWRVGFAETEIEKIRLKKPALFFTSIVLSHIDDETVSRICASIDKTSPSGSILNCIENWGTESHQRVWHIRTREWWESRFSGWELWFHGPTIQNRSDRHTGFHGKKI